MATANERGPSQIAPWARWAAAILALFTFLGGVLLLIIWVKVPQSDTRDLAMSLLSLVVAGFLARLAWTGREFRRWGRNTNV